MKLEVDGDESWSERQFSQRGLFLNSTMYHTSDGGISRPRRYISA